MQIKKGQIWKNKINEKFLVINTEGEYHDKNYCQLQCLQETACFFDGEILPNVSKEQFKNMVLVEEIEIYENEIKIKRLYNEIENYKRQINSLQDKIQYNKQKINELEKQK